MTFPCFRAKTISCLALSLSALFTSSAQAQPIGVPFSSLPIDAPSAGKWLGPVSAGQISDALTRAENPDCLREVLGKQLKDTLSDYVTIVDLERALTQCRNEVIGVMQQRVLDKR